MSFSEWKETELGLIPIEWDIKCIGDIAEVVSGGTPSTKKEEYYGGDIPWITPKDLSGYNSKYISQGERSITEDGLKNSSAKLIPKNSVLFSSRAPIGYVAISDCEVTTNQGFKNLVCNSQLSDYNFVYYKMKSLKASFEQVAGGSTFKEVSGKVVKDFKISLPPLNEQKLIASILSSLDDKIELNNQMNETLEEMAQALFKRWFVDFEFPNEEGQPYKSSGGEMVESELGMIPKGWKVLKLDDVGEIVAGGTPSTKCMEYYDGNISWITPKDLSGYDRKFIKKGERSITDLGLQKSSAKMMPEGAVLFSSRAPIGYITIADTSLCTNQGFKSIVCNSKYISTNYIYYLLNNEKEKIISIASGSTFKEVSGSTMKNYKIVVPDFNILEKFEIALKANDTLLKKNYTENDTLIELRDTILPKLMSGEIRVSDLEDYISRD